VAWGTVTCLSEGRLPNKCHFPSGGGAVTVSDYYPNDAALFHKREVEREKGTKER